jgi:hypothetical protein
MTVQSDFDIEMEEEEKKIPEEHDLEKKVKLLELQVTELQNRLKAEEERDDMCKICFSKEIDTVFLECAHRIACFVCSQNIKRVSSLNHFSAHSAERTSEGPSALLMFNSCVNFNCLVFVFERDKGLG